MNLVIQRRSRLKHVPSNVKLTRWLKDGLGKKLNTAEITLRIVNNKESAELNKHYRQKSGPTNVLSFVYSMKPICGDIVLCAPLIKAEKTWAHLVIHGVLHLMGYDHIKNKEAIKMEKVESQILKKLGFK